MMNGNSPTNETEPLLNPHRTPDKGSGPARNLDFDEAERLAETAVAKQPSGEQWPLSTPMSQLGSLGTGVGLYFYFVYYAGLALCFMSVLTLPVMISNFQGTLAFDPAEQIGFPQNVIVASSLGNRPMGQPLLLHSIMDFLCSLAFMAFLIYYRRAQLRAQREIQTSTRTASDYSILVSNLPSQVTEEEIIEHFSQWGDIAQKDGRDQVVICYRGYAARARVLELREKAEEDVEQFLIQMQSPTEFPDAREAHGAATKLLERANNELRQMTDRRQNRECCGYAFVTFRLESSCRKCLDDHIHLNWLQRLLGRTNPLAKMFRGSIPIQVRMAPQPSDILWENLEVGRTSRAFRFTATSCIALLLVLIATGLIAVVNGKHFFIGNEGILLTGLLNIVAVVIIIVSNVAMFVLIPILSVFEAHITKSKLEVHIMLRLWLFQVLNTLIAAFMFWDASRNKDGETNWGHWFADGGFLLVNVIIGDATLMNVIEFYRPFDVMIPRRVLGPKCMTQKRLNRVYQAPDFSLGMRFQMILKHFTLALALGSALPIAYWLIALLCIVTYWIDKYNVLRLYKKPALVNEDVAHVSVVYIAPFSLLLHLCLAPYFYTVVITCPTQLICTPSALLTPTYILLAVAGSILLLLWQPLLHKEPAVEYELVREREVPFHCVQDIEQYIPKHPWDHPQPRNETGSTASGDGSGRDLSIYGKGSRGNARSADQGEIGICVF